MHIAFPAASDYKHVGVSAKHSTLPAKGVGFVQHFFVLLTLFIFLNAGMLIPHMHGLAIRLHSDSNWRNSRIIIFSNLTNTVVPIQCCQGYNGIVWQKKKIPPF